MPAHPTGENGGWYFDFPTSASAHVDYVTTALDRAASTIIRASISVSTTGTPVFRYRTASDNTCLYPARVRLFIQERGDDMSGEGAMQFYRWWQNRGAFELAPGRATLSAPLDDPSQWTSVFGKSAAADAEALAGFRRAIGRIGDVGLTFGGGCFYGHGVSVTHGTARFHASSFVVQ